MVVAEGAGAPLGVLLQAAPPAEVTLLPTTIQQVPWELFDTNPECLILDGPMTPAKCEKTWPIVVWSRLCPRERTTPGPRTRTDANSAAIRSAGKSSAPMLGCRTFGAWWFATSDGRRITSPSFT